jgi:pSer/pThr/pTyr-binding forkhead associated (FHA) protein
LPPIVLTTLKFLFLALLYLFIARAIRVIYLDLVGPRVPRPRGAQQPRKRKGAPKSVAVNEPEKPVRTFSLSQVLTLGRAENCDVRLDDTYVSTLHARFFSKDGTWFVEDLGSTNGTYLNRVKVTSPSPIATGDEVRLGKTTVEVRRS